MGKKLIILLLSVLLICFVSSKPPVTSVQQFTEGFIIEHPPQDYIKQGEDYTLNFFLKNISNGVTIDNSSVTCSFFMQNELGTVILSSNVSYNGNYWELLIGGGNFPEPGIYSYGIDCEGGGLGGAEAKAFEVNSIGKELTTPQSILYGFFLTLLVLIFITNFISMGFLPDKNQKDEEGKILSINYMKYFRNVLWMTGYFLFIAITYIASNLAFAFLNEELVAQTLFIIFRISFGLAPVILIVWLIWIFVSMFHDKQFQNMLNRGIFPQDKL